MYVEEINDIDETIYAIGHEMMPDDSRSSAKYELNFDYAWLNIMLGEHGFNELKQRGRIFYFHEGDRNRIDLPFFEPMSDEDIKEAYDEAEELFKKINWDDNKSDSSND